MYSRQKAAATELKQQNARNTTVELTVEEQTSTRFTSEQQKPTSEDNEQASDCCCRFATILASCAFFSDIKLQIFYVPSTVVANYQIQKSPIHTLIAVLNNQKANRNNEA